MLGKNLWLTLVGLSGTLILGTACIKKSDSNLQSVKIQTADKAAAIVIRSLGTEQNFIIANDPNLICNVEIPLGSDFDPIKNESDWNIPTADKSCSRYGTYNDNPWKKSNFLPGKAFYLDGDVRQSYPVGRTYQAAENLKLDVKVCYGSRAASDVANITSCINENNNFFANEVKGLSEPEAFKKIDKAVTEALQILVYADSRLTKCYEESLAQTDVYEAGVKEPELQLESHFRFVRREGGTEDDRRYLQNKINNFSPAARLEYERRLLLAVRLGYLPDTATQTDIAYEPYGMAALTSFETAARANLSRFGVLADELAKDSDPTRRLGGLLTFLKDSSGQYYLNGQGNSSRLDSIPESTIKNQNGKIDAKLAKIYSDLIYRAVLFAKLSNLDPTTYFKTFQSNGFTESCDDYARYRIGMQSKRDSLIRNILMTSAAPSAAPGLLQGSWEASFKDSTNEAFSLGKSFVAGHRNEKYCAKTTENTLSYCPMKWEALDAVANRYDSLSVTVRNIYNIDKPLEKFTILLPSADKVYLSGKQIMSLEKEGFFGDGIEPNLYVEGVKGSVRELLFSARLTKKAKTCGEYAEGDVYLATDASGYVRCKADGSTELVESFANIYGFSVGFGKQAQGPDLANGVSLARDTPACADLCLANSACQAFDFQSSSKTCRLKSSQGTVISSIDHDNGAKQVGELSLFSITPNAEYPGNEQSSLSNINLSSCMNACKSSSTCTSASWNRSTKSCSLKSANYSRMATSPTINDSVVGFEKKAAKEFALANLSGFTGSAMRDRNGGDKPNGMSENSNLQACSNSCYADDSCIAFTFNAVDRRCYLKSSLTEENINQATITGQKVCKFGDLLRGNACRKACDATHAYLDAPWPISVDNANATASCRADGSIEKNIVCKSGYLKRGESCLSSCDGTHVEGEVWSAPGYSSVSCTASGGLNVTHITRWARELSTDNSPAGYQDGVCNNSEACVFRQASSGLLWSAVSSSKMDWYQARSYCSSLNLPKIGGGWRLPTLPELQAAMKDSMWYENDNLRVGLFAASSKSDYARAIIWSGTEYSDTVAQWARVYSGEVNGPLKTMTASTICVR